MLGGVSRTSKAAWSTVVGQWAASWAGLYSAELYRFDVGVPVFIVYALRR